MGWNAKEKPVAGVAAKPARSSCEGMVLLGGRLLGDAAARAPAALPERRHLFFGAATAQLREHRAFGEEIVEGVDPLEFFPRDFRERHGPVAERALGERLFDDGHYVGMARIGHDLGELRFDRGLLALQDLKEISRNV